MKFGFVGYGSIAKKHIAAIDELYLNSEVVLIRRNVCDINSDLKNISFRSSSDLNELKKVDVIFITNPTSLHVETINKVIEFNKPLFIEKPLADTVKELPFIIARINELQIINYHACALRFHPCIEYLKNNLLPQMRINEITVYCGSFLPEWRRGVNYRETYSANASMGGGVHLDLIHEVDFCYYLFGKPDMTNIFLTNKSSLEISAFDFAHYFWQYKTFNLQITLNYYRKDYKRIIELVAEDATYTIDIKKCSISKNGEAIFLDNSIPNDWYKRQIEYFMGQVKANQKCANDVNEAYKVLKLCLNESEK
jgi:predicted dehydrogenase